MKVIGLTGGVATGKSTIAQMFTICGIPVFDADACVHELLQKDQQLKAAIAQRFEGVVTSGEVDRKALGRAVFSDEAKLKQLEALLHPIVLEKEKVFIHDKAQTDALAVVLDIPLLFETHSDELCDIIVVTDCEPQTQRDRVLQRAGMNEVKLNSILARQMKREERNKRADIVLSTEQSKQACLAQVKQIVSEL